MRFTPVHAIAGSAALVGAIIVGVALISDRQGPVTPAAQLPAATSASPELNEIDASPSGSAGPSVKPSPSRSPSASPKPKPSPTPKPSRVPPKLPGVPPPAPKPAPVPSGKVCPYHETADAPVTAVQAALEAAAARRFWTVSQVTLPVSLIEAVAMQESGWQSGIVACDGGIGTMQVMPSTAAWLNDDSPFDMSEDVHTLSGNTMIGSAYLQWLIRYFGNAYFDGVYVLREADCQQDEAVPDHREWCLLNAVISAYNYGQGAVDNEVGDGDDTFYPNHAYIESVRALMLRY